MNLDNFENNHYLNVTILQKNFLQLLVLLNHKAKDNHIYIDKIQQVVLPLSLFSFFL